jgi:hypothetical protein
MPLKITTWNINSVRLRIDLVAKFIKSARPDVLCLQETKCPDDAFPLKRFKGLGYEHIALNGQKGYHGVAIVSLALVAHTGRQHPIANARFSVLEPVDFYAMGPGESGARDVLEAWQREGILSNPGTRLSAVLFAWGDLAQELVQTG